MTTKNFNELSKGIKDEVISYIEENQPSIHWGYNDELSSDYIEMLLDPESGEIDLHEKIWDLNLDCIFELERDLIEECAGEFEERITEQLGVERNDWEEDFVEFCQDYVCVDLAIDDLIRQNGDEVFFYETGVEIDDSSLADEEEIEQSVQTIKSTLSISHDEFDKDLKLMVLQASYGGSLVVYFKAGLKDAIGLKNSQNKNIKFSGNVSIAIINTGNGSGDSTEITHEFELPFVAENLYFERSIKYNYSFAVCGMTENWCDGTIWGTVDQKEIKEIGNNLRLSLSEDKRLAKKWRSTGKCTFGDMDMGRHGRFTYINNYPCGTKCLDCGTFWID